MALCECGGFKNVHDGINGKVFTQCWKCGKETVEPDPILSRSFDEIKAANRVKKAFTR